MRVVACVDGNRRHRGFFFEQAKRSALQAQAAVELERRFADHAAKYAMKMKSRQRRATRQPFQVERLVETCDHPFDRALHGELVEGLCFRLHESRSTASRAGLLDADCAFDETSAARITPYCVKTPPRSFRRDFDIRRGRQAVGIGSSRLWERLDLGGGDAHHVGAKGLVRGWKRSSRSAGKRSSEARGIA